MRHRKIPPHIILACLFPLLSASLAAQVGPSSCPASAPLHLALVFDQSLSTPTDSARGVYPTILSTLYSMLHEKDEIHVFRLPDSTETEVELIQKVTVQPESPVAAQAILSELLARPTQDSDLAKAVRSVASRLRGSECKVVVLVTDGSLSPSHPIQPKASSSDVLRITRDFQNAVEEARQHVALYALGYRSRNRLAVDSTHWPLWRRTSVIDDRWNVDLRTLRGDSLLALAFAEHYFEYSPRATADLLLFSDSAVFRTLRGYRGESLRKDEQLVDVYLRGPGGVACQRLRVPAQFRRINGTDEGCLFHGMNPPGEISRWIDDRDDMDDMRVVYRSSALERIPSENPYRHAFIIGSSPCTDQTLLAHVAEHGRWPPTTGTGRKYRVAWSGVEAGPFPDSIMSIGDGSCFGLFDLFTDAGGAGEMMWPVFVSATGDERKRSSSGVKAFKRYPLGSELVLTHRLLNRKIWRVHGRIALTDRGYRESWLIVAGSRILLAAEDGPRDCRGLDGVMSVATCYVVEARVTAVRPPELGVLLGETEKLEECRENCFPVHLKNDLPLKRLGLVTLVALLAAMLLEGVVKFRLKRSEAVGTDAPKRDPHAFNVMVNVGSTAYWIALAYAIGEAAMTPGAPLWIQVTQVVLSFLGTGVLISASEAAMDVASNQMMPP